MKGISPLWVAVAVVVVLAGAAIIYNVWGAKLANPEPVGRAIYGKPPPPDPRTKSGRLAFGDLDVSGPSIVQRDKRGNEVWSAKTEGELEVSDQDGRVAATGVVWTLTRGDQTVTLKSGRMEAGWSGGDVVFGGDIDIQDARGRRFAARQARFEAGTEKIICEGGVTWEAGRYTAAAQTLVIDVKHRRLRLRGGVTLKART
jgi:hypothetical protein